jgi:hypothetical protein
MEVLKKPNAVRIVAENWSTCLEFGRYYRVIPKSLEWLYWVRHGFDRREAFVTVMLSNEPTNRDWFEWMVYSQHVYELFDNIEWRVVETGEFCSYDYPTTIFT